MFRINFNLHFQCNKLAVKIATRFGERCWNKLTYQIHDNSCTHFFIFHILKGKYNGVSGLLLHFLLQQAQYQLQVSYIADYVVSQYSMVSSTTVSDLKTLKIPAFSTFVFFLITVAIMTTWIWDYGDITSAKQFTVHRSATTMKPPAQCCVGPLCHENSSDLLRPLVSVTKTSAAYPLTHISCEVGTPIVRPGDITFLGKQCKCTPLPTWSKKPGHRLPLLYSPVPTLTCPL